MSPQLVPDREPISRRLDDGRAIRGYAPRVLFDYWQAKRQGRPYPAGEDIELMDLWPIAANVGVLDVLDGGNDFFHRYWGTRLAEATGHDASGITMTEMFGASSDAATVNFRRVFETGTPLLSYRRLNFIEERDHVSFEAIYLPLGPAGGPVTQVICGYDFNCDIEDVLGI